nr:MAG TPA: hypothetical protein [Caudoviricetes sp.]
MIMKLLSDFFEDNGDAPSKHSIQFIASNSDDCDEVQCGEVNEDDSTAVKHAKALSKKLKSNDYISIQVINGIEYVCIA